MVALVHVSNMLGSILDTAYVAEQARKVCFFRLTVQGTVLRLMIPAIWSLY